MKTISYLLYFFALAFLTQSTGVLGHAKPKTEFVLKRDYVGFISSPLRYERREAINEIYENILTTRYWVAHEYYDSVFPFIIESLYDDDYWIRHTSANIMSKLADQMPVCITDIYYELQNPLENDVAASLISAFGSAGGMWASPFHDCLIPWLSNEDVDIRWAATNALANMLGDINDESIIDLLIYMVNDESPRVVRKALEGLIIAGSKAGKAKEIVDGLVTNKDVHIHDLAEEFIRKLENG